MEQNFNDIDHLFKEELGGYAETPPPAVWDALEKRLKGEDKRRTFPFRWWWYVSIVSFIVLLGSSVLWKMSRNAGSQEKTASIAAAIPQQTATTATPETTGSDKTNITVSKPSKKELHTAEAAPENNAADDNGTEEKTAVNRTHHRRHHKRNTAAQSQKKEANDELYADTDDDQYTVSGSRNSSKNNEAGSNQPEYIREPRTQHNIRVAETMPTQGAHEDNYGSYAAVTASRAKATANTHYDIDLSDEPADEQTNSNANRSVARNKPPREILYASTSKHVRTHAKPVTASAASSAPATTSAPVAKTNTKKHHVTRENKAVKTETAQRSTPEVAAADVSRNITVEEKKKPVTNNSPTVASATTARVHSSVPKVNADKAPVAKGHKVNDANTAAIEPGATSTSSPKQNADKITAVKENNPKSTAGSNTPAVVASTATPHKHSASKAKAKKEANNSAVNAAPVTAVAAPIVANAPPATTTKPASAEKRTVGKAHGVISKPVASTSVPTAKKKEHSPKQAENNYAVPGNTSVKPEVKEHKTAKKANMQNTTAAIAKTDVKPQATGKSTARKTSNTEAVAEETQPGAKPVADAADHKKAAGVKKTTPVAEVTKPDNKATAEVPAIAKKENKAPKKGSARNTNGNNSKSNAPIQQQVYAYSNSLQKFSLADETVVLDNLKVNSFADRDPIVSSSDEQAIGTFKKDNGAGDAKTAAAGATAEHNDSSVKHHHLFNGKFEYGVKGGYETALNAYGANKMVISPYLQYNLSDKFSILTQPSIKVSHVSEHHVGQDRLYNDTSHVGFTLTDSGALYTIVYAGGNGVVIQSTLRKYDATYDSTVKWNSTGGNYTEIELPLMLKYKIGKGLSVYGGANAIFSKYTNIKGRTSNYRGTVQTVTVLPIDSPATTPSLSRLILPGKPIEQYSGPLYPEQKGGLLRLGYMLGFSYEYKKRYMFDLLVQQAMVKPHIEAGVNTNQPLSLPYFRLTLGYKLSK